MVDDSDDEDIVYQPKIDCLDDKDAEQCKKEELEQKQQAEEKDDE